MNPKFGDKLGQRESARGDDPAAPERTASEAPYVLVVDDEPEITRSVAELLSPDYKVLTANSADEALRLLEEQPVSVILSDQRMPGGTGTELLARSLAIAPEATRILFTGYSDVSAVIEAVNAGQVYHYLAKPWRPEELRAVLAQGVKRFELAAENQRLLVELTQANEELLAANRELQEFTYSIAHDLRAPLRAIDGFSAMIEQDAGEKLGPADHDHLRRVRAAAQRMGALIDGLLALTRATRRDMRFEQVDLTALAETELARLRTLEPGRQVESVVAPGLSARADAELSRVIITNLVGNAWKFTSKVASARIEVGACDAGGARAFFVRDNGAGFDPRYAAHLFGAFQRMHPAVEFEGEGIGLAMVQRLVGRHGGRVWAEAAVDKGATFYFTLPGRG